MEKKLIKKPEKKDFRKLHLLLQKLEESVNDVDRGYRAFIEFRAEFDKLELEFFEYWNNAL
jgi:hypothetical protein